MKKIIVLGAGMVGRAMAIDLCREFEVTSADIDKQNLSLLKNFPIKTIRCDLTSAEKIKSLIKKFDLVIGAVPGFMGFKTLQTVIRSKKNVVDISFFPEDPFKLDALAKKMNVTAIVDCGVCPGLSNIILGYHNKQMQIESYECMVGGLPSKKEWPYKYKAFFSPSDVIEEYIRPARIMENGKEVIKEAMTDAELVDFEEVGTLEAFNTDGLRSLLVTMKIPNMIEKTLRYPGHIEIMKIFRETGFFSSDNVELKGKKVKPVELTSKLLFAFWKPAEDEDEFTIMRLKISGTQNNQKKDIEYLMVDRFDSKSKTSSMARTTGYTCTATARLILDGSFTREGICPPEYIGKEPGCYEKIISLLEERNIRIRAN
ncbi:MAG TPA: saccharopine dehydrogenase C-terminal domain-containing protein [Ignavibacteriaceae bacterium]